MRRSFVRFGLLASVAMMAVPTVAQAENAVAGVDSAAPNADEIVVKGDKPVTVASAGTKSDLPLIETPQSITVIDGADIAAQGLQNLNQALRTVAGVTPETRGAAAEVYDQFKLRGFDAPIYLDGLKLFPSSTGYANSQIDVSRLDRIEIVKGPASALYGQSGPGGLVVEQSKLPLDRAFYGAVAGTYGNYSLYRVDADVGGKIGTTTLWRLYGSANGAHSQQTYGRRDRQTVSGAVTLGSGTPTSLTLLAAYSHDPRNGNYGVFPALGTLIPNPAGKISTHFYGGEPGDFFSRDQLGLTYIFRHDFGGGWAFRSSGRYQYVKSDLGIVYTSGSQLDPTQTAPTIFSRASYSTHETLNGWTYDNQLTGKFDTGPIHHSVMLGVDRQVLHSAELSAFGTGTPIDVFRPVYGTMPTPRTPAQVPGIFGGVPAFVSTHTRQQGIYAQDQISVGGLRIALSGREDWARQASGTQVQDNRKFTGRAGVLYLTSFGLAPYASYSTSFEPQPTLLVGGTLAKPSVGKQVEAGVKYQMPGTQVFITAAYFHIEQTNVVVSDPVTFSSTQAGKVRSQGVEVEAKAPLPYGFNAKVAFSRQKVRNIKDVDPLKVGRGLATVGKGGTTAELDWSPKAGPAQGLLIGGAVRHVDSVYADYYFNPNTGVSTPMNSPSYTVFDAMLRYDFGKANPRLTGLSAALNMTNIFDKKYLTSCFANYGWCWYGNRRTIEGTIGFRW